MTRKRPLLVPLTLTCALACLALVTPVRGSPRALGATIGVAAALAVWSALLAAGWIPARCELTIDLRKQHYLQASAQLLVFVYWGWYWPQVYASAHLIAMQLVFAYAFDMLLVWSRGERYSLGFGPVPVVFSINLFLWFKPDWLILQFALVALGFLAKQWIGWTREGRRVHIFNPSSFPLAVFSLGLLAFGASGITWGQEIASTQFYPPHMYAFLFLVGLPGQFLFGVTTMTMSAVVSTYAFGVVYYSVTGIYFFYDAYIPIAVFLGMHLLFTDPSTSPRTELGRIAFGVLYGLSVVALYELLGRAGLPTYYDKLLQVPLLNLSVKGIDWIARSRPLRFFNPERPGPALGVHGRRAVYMSIWVAVFVAMSAVQGVGDDHPGQWVPFWQNACADGRPYACPYLADLHAAQCERGSGWACNEAALLHIVLSRTGEDLRRTDPGEARALWVRGCDLKFAAACANLDAVRTRSALVTGPPGDLDYPVILRGGKGEIRERDPVALRLMACHQGWPDTCD